MSIETVTISADENDVRLDRWFKRRFPDLTQGQVEKLLRTGQIRVDGKRAKSNQRLLEGQNIRIPPMPKQEENPREPVLPDLSQTAEAKALADRILYIDDDVLVLNKPAGLAVQGGTGTERHLDGMLDALRFNAPERPRLVHRLDKDTSGVLLLGRNVFAAQKLTASFRSRDARKCYWALVVGAPPYAEGRIDAALAKGQGGIMGDKMLHDEKDGKRAVTWYRIVEQALRRAAWLEMEPRTGRTHQLRVHAALLGTPIQGDGKYGGKEAYLSGIGISRKLHLHARALRLPHPRSGLIEVVAPLPEHMAASFSFFDFHEKNAGKPFTHFEA